MPSGREGHHGIHRRDHHDAPATPLPAHLLGGSLAAVEDAVQIDAHDEVPVFGSDLGQPLPARHPGIRHEDVERTEQRDRLRDETYVLLGS